MVDEPLSSSDEVLPVPEPGEPAGPGEPVEIPAEADCGEARALAFDEALGELSGQPAERLQAHIKRCPICRRLLNEFVETRRLVEAFDRGTALRPRFATWAAALLEARATYRAELIKDGRAEHAEALAEKRGGVRGPVWQPPDFEAGRRGRKVEEEEEEEETPERRRRAVEREKLDQRQRRRRRRRGHAWAAGLVVVLLLGGAVGLGIYFRRTLAAHWYTWRLGALKEQVRHEAADGLVELGGPEAYWPLLLDEKHPAIHDASPLRRGEAVRVLARLGPAEVILDKDKNQRITKEEMDKKIRGAIRESLHDPEEFVWSAGFDAYDRYAAEREIYEYVRAPSACPAGLSEPPGETYRRWAIWHVKRDYAGSAWALRVLGGERDARVAKPILDRLAKRRAGGAGVERLGPAERFALACAGGPDGAKLLAEELRQRLHNVVLAPPPPPSVEPGATPPPWKAPPPDPLDEAEELIFLLGETRALSEAAPVLREILGSSNPHAAGPEHRPGRLCLIGSAALALARLEGRDPKTVDPKTVEALWAVLDRPAAGDAWRREQAGPLLACAVALADLGGPEIEAEARRRAARPDGPPGDLALWAYFAERERLRPKTFADRPPPPPPPVAPTPAPSAVTGEEEPAVGGGIFGEAPTEPPEPSTPPAEPAAPGTEHLAQLFAGAPARGLALDWGEVVCGENELARRLVEAGASDVLLATAGAALGRDDPAARAAAAGLLTLVARGSNRRDAVFTVLRRRLAEPGPGHAETLRVLRACLPTCVTWRGAERVVDPAGIRRLRNDRLGDVKVFEMLKAAASDPAAAVRREAVRLVLDVATQDLIEHNHREGLLAVFRPLAGEEELDRGIRREDSLLLAVLGDRELLDPLLQDLAAPAAQRVYHPAALAVLTGRHFATLAEWRDWSNAHAADSREAWLNAVLYEEGTLEVTNVLPDGTRQPATLKGLLLRGYRKDEEEGPVYAWFPPDRNLVALGPSPESVQHLLRAMELGVQIDPCALEVAGRYGVNRLLHRAGGHRWLVRYLGWDFRHGGQLGRAYPWDASYHWDQLGPREGPLSLGAYPAWEWWYEGKYWQKTRPEILLAGLRAQLRLANLRQVRELGRVREAVEVLLQLVADLEACRENPALAYPWAAASPLLYDWETWRRQLLDLTLFDFGPLDRRPVERAGVLDRWREFLEKYKAPPAAPDWQRAGYEQALEQLDAPDYRLRQTALERLFRLRATRDGFDPLAPAAEREAAVARWRAWWTAARERLRWDPTWRELDPDRPLDLECFFYLVEPGGAAAGQVAGSGARDLRAPVEEPRIADWTPEELMYPGGRRGPSPNFRPATPTPAAPPPTGAPPAGAPPPTGEPPASAPPVELGPGETELEPPDV